MEVIFKAQDMKKILPMTEPKTVGLIGFSIKDPELNQHHPGHAYLLKEAKQQCDILVAMYAQPLLYSNYMETEEAELNPIHLKYSTDFCATNNVDIMYIPDQKDLRKNVDKEKQKKKVINVLKNMEKNHYHKFKPHDENLFKGILIFYKQTINKWKKNKVFHSWSDGYWRFTQKELYKEHKLPEVILLNPFRRSDGLIYSSTILQCNPNELKMIQIARQYLKDYLTNPNRKIMEDNIRSIDNQSESSLMLQSWAITQGLLLGDNNLLLSTNYYIPRLGKNKAYRITEFYQNESWQ
jgi:pantothenate synthetase